MVENINMQHFVEFEFDVLGKMEISHDFREELQKVIADINDPDRDPKKPREIHIKLSFLPANEEKTGIIFVSEVKPAKLAPLMPKAMAMAVTNEGKKSRLLIQKNQLDFGFDEGDDDEETGNLRKIK